jgi:poly-gamma-glutamate synthesis protein (capsule biosynthesis protein)
VILFCLETGGGQTRRVRLHPTVIREFQARRARGWEGQDIAARMRGLCAELGTSAEWRDPEGCLEILLP